MKTTVMVIINGGIVEEIRAFYDRTEAERYFMRRKLGRSIGNASGLFEVETQ